MPIDKSAFIDSFIAELKENTEAIDSSIIKFKKNPSDEEQLTIILRALHTIKGSARMLDFFCIENLSHNLENVYKGLNDGKYGLTKDFIALSFAGTDYMRHGIDLIKSKGTDLFNITKFIEVCEKAVNNEPYNPDSLSLTAEENEPAPNNEDDEKDRAPQSKKENGLQIGESIRVKVKKIDSMISLANDLITKQFQLKKSNELINELELKLTTLMSQQEASFTSDMQNELKSLLKLVQFTRKDFVEHESGTERLSLKLQEELIGLRMLPLNLILGSLDKMVEKTALSVNKEIDFSITGHDIMLDKAILEKIKDPIIHIVRNACDHGIETPDERQKAGKNMRGSLSVTCYHEGGNIVIKIKDDGKGLDYDRIRQKAITLYPENEDIIKDMTHSQLNNYLFTTGFSTSHRVTELSGRGVGLDIVRHNIEKVKGKIFLESEPNKGTQFTLILPLSLATIEGFFIIAGERKFFLPSNYVKEIIILNEHEQLDLLHKKVFKHRSRIVSLYNLSDMLGMTTHKEKTHGNFVIITELVGEQIGISVKTIVEYSSLIFKPLPRNLRNFPYIQGVVFDENFNIIPILYIPEIITHYKSYRHTGDSSIDTTDKKGQQTILVVDDSLNTREIEKSILELEDYTVITAVDGLDALQKIKEHPVDLVVSDIMMPRMDGFTMLRQLKEAKKFKHIPVILVSSQDSPKDKELGLKLGAQAFIIKSNFDRKNLINEVKKHI